MALNGLICAEVMLRNYSLTHSLTHSLGKGILVAIAINIT